MLRASIIALLLCACGPASAQKVDWRHAGGDLFGAPVGEAAEATVQDESVRVQALSQPYQEIIDQAAADHGLDPKLLHALVATESAYRPRAVSPAGAGGLT